MVLNQHKQAQTSPQSGRILNKNLWLQFEFQCGDKNNNITFNYLYSLHTQVTFKYIHSLLHLGGFCIFCILISSCEKNPDVWHIKKTIAFPLLHIFPKFYCNNAIMQQYRILLNICNYCIFIAIEIQQYKPLIQIVLFYTRTFARKSTIQLLKIKYRAIGTN